jgi:tricarballylate dehydrogenase
MNQFNAATSAAGDVPLSERRTTGISPPKSRGAAALATPPFAAYPLRPGVTFTHYGVAVDNHLRVMKNDGEPIQNVFAAGMVMAANVLGDGYLAGLGVSLSAVFGRLAGEEAARSAATSA